MLRHHFIIIAAAALLTASACTGSQPDPVAGAIAQAAVKGLPGDYAFRLSSLEKIDSTTFRTEIDRRKDGTTDYDLTVRRKQAISYAEVKGFMLGRDDVISASNSPLRN